MELKQLINMLTMCGRKCWETYHVFVVLVETLETLVWFTQTHDIYFLLYSKFADPISSLFMHKIVIYHISFSHQLEKFKENIMQRMLAFNQMFLIKYSCTYTCTLIYI